MNLVVIAAVIAVASAAKLDRTYLPPPSAKTAGGSPGSLQTPFASNSFNNGLGGIPKGGFENDFKGVVIDAAAPGTRASGDGETGLGAPRISYGSTNSKVGDAAFRGSPAGFRGFPQPNQIENQQSTFPNQQNQIPDGATAGTTVNAQSFIQGPGNFQASSEPKYQRSQELNARDAAASIVRYDSEVGTDTFSYSFETDNGISAEESGVATNGVQAQGGFSYTGDDGQVYSVTYTADEGGYQPKGDHLPTPPPIPEEILKSLEQNAREEAAGLVDDGSYDTQKYNAEGDYTENDGANSHNGRQPAQFGNRPESDASASGTFINQNNQPFVRPTAQAGLTGQSNSASANFGSSPQGPNSFSQTTSSSNARNGFGQSVSNKPNAFGQTVSSPNAPNAFGQHTSAPNGANSFGHAATSPNVFSQAASSSNAPNGFGQSTSAPNGGNGFGPVASRPNAFGQAAVSSNGNNGFGQTNQNTNGFQQNKPAFNSGAEDSENANTFVSPAFENSQNVIQGQPKPQQPLFGKPQPNSQAFNGQTTSGSINSNNPFGPSSNNGNVFGQRQPSSQTGNGFGNNEYLPPVNGNRRPAQSNPQRPSSFGMTQSFNQFSQSTNKPDDSGASSSFISSAQSTVESQRPQFGTFQNNQFTNNQNPTNLPTSQSFAAAQSKGKPSFGSQNTPSLGQASGSPFLPFNQQKSTAEPVTELTTPFEDNSHSTGNTQSSTFGSFGVQSSQSRPTQSPFGSQPNGSPQFTAPVSTSASAYASTASSSSQGFNSRPIDSNTAPSSSFSNQRPQSTSKYSQENRFGLSQSSDAFSQNQPSNVQFASSTQRPIFGQNTQAQGPDDSYYYNQPSKAFNTPNSPAQGSRFPNTPFDQFDRVTQRPSFQSNAQASVSQQNFPGSSFNQNGQLQGSTRYPQPPTLSTVAPTSPTRGSTASSFNGITQASASSFSSGAPTSSTPFGSQNTFTGFGRKPAQQPNDQFNNQGFGQSSSKQQGIQTTAIPQSFSDINQQQNNFQIQQTSNTDASPAPSQQYQGEIYEYTKPAQTLPPPTEQDKQEGFGQFGNPAKFQSEQQAKAQETTDSQPGQTLGQPVFAPQGSRPQFGQKTQTQTQFNAQGNFRPQFGQQTTPFGNAQATQASAFAQTSDVREPENTSGNQLNAQDNLNGQFTQQFGSRPSETQPSQFNRQPQKSGSQEQRPTSPCCKRLPSAPQAKPQTNQFGDQVSQFGSSDVTAQDFKPNQDSAQSLAGKGEVFGGPRKPPSFDEQTGYHY